MKLAVLAGTTNYTILVWMGDSSVADGSGKTAIAYDDIKIYYTRIETDNDVTSAQLTTAALAALTDAHADGGWIEIDATNQPGLYRLDLSDAILAIGAWSIVITIVDAGANDIAPCNIEIQLDPVPSNIIEANSVAVNIPTVVNANVTQVNGDAVNILTEMDANVTKISGDTTAADNLELDYDGTGFAKTNSTIGTTTTVTNGVSLVDDAITSAKFDESTAFPIESADSGITQIARIGGYGYSLQTLSYQIDDAQDYLNVLTGVDGVTLATAQALYAPAKAGDLMLADVTQISGDSVAADNLESTYDGTGYTDSSAPATQGALGNLTSGSASINTTAVASPGGFVITSGINEVNTEDSTHALDGTVHSLEDTVGNVTDAYYIFNVGGNGVPVSVTWEGYANSNGDSYTISAYNWGITTFEQVGTITGANGSTVIPKTFSLTNAHVGTGVNIGLVHFRFSSVDGTKFSTDRILCSYAVVAQSVGYADGAIWVDSAGSAGAVDYVNGTADNPCPWANALTISSSLGIKRFRIANGNTVTLSANSDGYSFIGRGWNIALGGQSIEGTFIEGATVAGIGTATVTAPRFDICGFGACTIPPAVFTTCGFGSGSGQFTAGSAGQYYLADCFSMVAGSGSPAFVFTGLGSTTGINNRRWAGGATYTLDSDCTLSHEVVTGGGTTVTTGGANVEIRGITRSVTCILSGAGTVQFVGTTGPITLSGAATTTVNLYGVSASLADTSSGTTVTNKTVNQETINTEADTALTDYAPSVAGDLMGLADDAITSAKFDESTAFPLKAEDASTTQIARVGADGDTLETLSDQIDSTSTHTAANVVTAMETDGSKLDHLWEMTEDDAGTRRLTTNALEQAPDTISGITLADDSITSDKFDESTAFPLKAEDASTTQIARVGADGDTLETLSDQIDLQATATALTSHDNKIGTPIALDGGSATIGSMLTKIADDNSGSDFDATTDSLQALRDRGDSAWISSTDSSLLLNTTIATLASQTSFTLTAGSADDDTYNNTTIIITDQSTSTQKAVGSILNYTGSSKTVTLSEDPGIFTMAVGDTIDILASSVTDNTDILNAISTAQDDLDIITGLDGTILATSQTLYIPAVAGDLMGLADDAITSAKFDESTAFPLKAEDASTTQIARVGADGDTLETLSDQIDGVSVPSAADVADAVWDEAIAGHTTVTTFGGKNQKVVPSETIGDYKATGFSTHAASDVVTAMEIDGSKLDHLWEMTEDDAGTRRLTTNALEQAPDSDTTTGLTLHSDYDPAKTAAQAGDLMGLANDAITSDKFDESTAFPIKSADTGVTQIARTGADGDTLETLSDQVDSTATVGAAMTLATDAVSAAALKTDAVTEIVNAMFAKTGLTAGGSATYGDMVKALYGMAKGKISKSGDVYTFYDDDDATPLFVLTISDTGRASA